MSPSEHSDSRTPRSELPQASPSSIRRDASCNSRLSAHSSLHINSFGALKPRQITMIAIGGAINTGLTIGAGNALTLSGPASIVICYTFSGILVYLVLCALGEVASWSTVPWSIQDHAVRFCHPALGFTLGWIYWLKYLVATPNQLTAGTLVLSYWLDVEYVNPGIWITAFLTIIITANYFGTSLFGKYEFVLSSFKVLVLFGLIILSLVLAFGGGPDRDRKGFRYWKDPGAFHIHDDGVLGQFRAICRTMPSATFAYLGSEHIGMTVLHNRNPRTTAARAIKLTFYRMLILNIISVTLIGMLVPYNSRALAFARDADKPTTASPFVAVLQLAKIHILPGILNGCILLFVLSSANFSLHMATKLLYEMALEENAPAFLCRTSRGGTPVYALGVCSAMTSLAYLNISGKSKLLFGHFVNVVTMFSLLTWKSILVTHIAFLRALRVQKVPDRALAFRAPLGAYGSWLALVCCILVSFMRGFEIIDRAVTGKGFDYVNFITSYLGIPLYICLVVGYRVTTRRKRIDPAEADLWAEKNAEQHEADVRAGHVEKKGWLDRFIEVLFF